MRSSVAGRRSATPTLKSAKSFRSSALSDAVLDEDGDIPFPEDVTGKHLPFKNCKKMNCSSFLHIFYSGGLETPYPL